MKNTKQIILLFLMSFTCLSAQTSGTAYYKYVVNKNIFTKEQVKKNDKKRNGNLSFINKAINENIDNFEFKLRFTKVESLFKFIESMDVDNNNMGYKIAKIFSNAKKVYYQNKKENILLTQTKSYGEELLILDSLSNLKWELINVKKKIGAYTCYKAITIKTVKNSKGVFKKEIVAWYTPQIPFNFGPKEYGGLPGLIIVLEEDFLKYYITKIILNSKKTIKIKKPTIGKKLNIAEYKIMEKEIMKKNKMKFKN